MCKAQSEGGQRCASSARERLDKANAAYEANPGVKRLEAIIEAEIVYASTPEGAEWARKAQAEATTQTQRDYYASTLAQGAALRERNAAVALAAKGPQLPDPAVAVPMLDTLDAVALAYQERSGGRSLFDDYYARDAIEELYDAETFDRYVAASNRSQVSAFGSDYANQACYEAQIAELDDAMDGLVIVPGEHDTVEPAKQTAAGAARLKNKTTRELLTCLDTLRTDYAYTTGGRDLIDDHFTRDLVINSHGTAGFNRYLMASNSSQVSLFGDSHTQQAVYDIHLAEIERVIEDMQENAED